MNTSSSTPDPMTAIHAQIDDLGVYLATWERRDAGTPRPLEVAAGVNALDAIDTALRHLHRLRDRLVTENRQFNDDLAASTDALIERLRERGATPLPDETWLDTGSGPGHQDRRTDDTEEN